MGCRYAAKNSLAKAQRRKVFLMRQKSFAHVQALAERQISPEERAAALEVLKSNKAAIFVVAYNAERFLESLIERVPADLLPHLAEIFVIDDSSPDSTFDVATRLRQKYDAYNLNVYRTPFNRGYGGNQKLGYLYCIEKGYDIVVLLHGDGQYPPEYLPRVFAAFQDGADAVLASRMLSKRMALRGGMPLYKWIGNQILTGFENQLLGTHLSEFHTGFRAFRVSALRKIPFAFNSDDFHFDTEILVQALATKWKIREVSIPAHYGSEKSHVNGFQYAFNCMKAVVKYRLVNLGLFYQRNLDFGLFDTDNYQFKKSPNSLHQYVINKTGLTPEIVSVELGANKGILSSEIAAKVKEHVAIDIAAPELAGAARPIGMDLNERFSERLPKSYFDCCIALDVIEHMDEPEKFLCDVFEILKVNGKLFISTANICYLPVRLSLLLGQFNYGRRGILDRTHKRLFSVASFKKLIRQYGFKLDSVRGFAPPVTDLISRGWLMSSLETFHSFFSRWFPNLFAYNFLVTATRMDALPDIFEMTVHQERWRDGQEELRERAKRMLEEHLSAESRNRN